MSKIIYGVLWWALIFVEVSIIGFIPALASMADSKITMNTTGYVVHFVFVAILALIFARMYFKDRIGGWKKGLILFIWVFIVSFLLDAIVTVPLFAKDYGLYYSHWSLWVGVAITLLGFVLGSELFKKSIPVGEVIIEETEITVSDDDSNEL